MLCDTKQEHTVMLCMKTGTKHSIKDENSKDGGPATVLGKGGQRVLVARAS